MSELEGYTHLRDVPYSDVSRLNTLDVWLPEQTRENESEGKGLWVIYIHGGAWRDPLITSQSLLPTLSHLSHLPLGGISSLSYRLSPYPSHPTCPSHPSDPSRNATHPDHRHDILAALAHLRSHHPIDDYVLVGHSCGATLAFQAAAALTPPPAAVLGVEGIYDVEALVADNVHPAYRDFVTAAFGADEGAWGRASPVHLEPAAAKVVLAHSRGDELVAWSQVEGMERALRAGGYVDAGQAGRKQVRRLELVGTHDQVWEDGSELARAVEVAVRWLVGGGED